VNLDKLTELFEQYIKAFVHNNTSAVSQCYQVPCTLSTPDKMLVIENQSDFEKEFEQIFLQLKQAGMSKVKPLKASCLALTDTLVLACIDWAFIDGSGDVFADFSAFYHLASHQEGYKIISVSSQDLSQSKVFTHKITLKDS